MGRWSEGLLTSSCRGGGYHDGLEQPGPWIRNQHHNNRTSTKRSPSLLDSLKRTTGEERRRHVHHSGHNDFTNVFSAENPSNIHRIKNSLLGSYDNSPADCHCGTRIKNDPSVTMKRHSKSRHPSPPTILPISCQDEPICFSFSILNPRRGWNCQSRIATGLHPSCESMDDTMPEVRVIKYIQKLNY